MATYVLNALVPPSQLPGLIFISPASWEEVQEAIRRGAQSFVGHPATAKLLGVTPNRGEAKPQPGDTAYVLRLKFRPAQSGVEIEVKPEDLEVLRVEYMNPETLFIVNAGLQII